MGTSLDALNAPSSLTARRQAASNLPNFELPPPTNLQFASNLASKFPPLSSLPPGQATTSSVSVGNLLTPPSNSTSEILSPVPSGLNGGNTPNNHGILPFTPTFQGWPSGTTPGGFHAGYTPQPWQNSNPLYATRPVFSPSLNSLIRNSNPSPSTSEGQSLPPPPYDLNALPAFHQSLPLSAPPHITTTSQPQQPLSNHLMSPPGNITSHTAANGNESINPKAPHGSTIYAAHQPPPNSQQPNYQYPGPPAIQQSPHSASAPARLSSAAPQSAGGAEHSHPFVRHPYPSYSLPNMPGPVMSNLQNSGGNMSMVGSMQPGMMSAYNSVYAANNQGMYVGQPPLSQAQGTAERPFKCDQCPQGFNRNHDLKRHKRIHLAVKPFPCNYCDKSFSRKDALKRHILVKGCGRRGEADTGFKDEKGQENVKSESGSDDAADSPAMTSRV